MTPEQREEIEQCERSFLRSFGLSGSSAAGARYQSWLKLKAAYNAFGLDPPSREWLRAKHKDIQR